MPSYHIISHLANGACSTAFLPSSSHFAVRTLGLKVDTVCLTISQHTCWETLTDNGRCADTEGVLLARGDLGSVGPGGMEIQGVAKHCRFAAMTSCLELLPPSTVCTCETWAWDSISQGSGESYTYMNGGRSTFLSAVSQTVSISQILSCLFQSSQPVLQERAALVERWAWSSPLLPLCAPCTRPGTSLTIGVCRVLASASLDQR